jgi:hypothetical protein
MSDRRTFLLAMAGALAGASGLAQRRARPTIVLRSSWQTVNIGDIGHTPGVLRLIEEHIPGAEIRLWPSDVGHGVDALLRRRFPQLVIVQSPGDVDAALQDGDLLLHGSGPSLVGRASLDRWARETGKPYGVYGITFPGVYGRPEEMRRVNPLDVELLTNARFAFFRDSVSLSIAKNSGVRCPIMEFAPDGAFAVDVGDDGRAEAFLSEHRLEPGRFVCVIPRTRFTPYWEVAGRNTPFDPWRHERNEALKEHDNRPLRDAIVAVVRQASMKVLVCPEDETQVALGKEILVDPLPADVKPSVVWRDRYWLTDEAVSTYRRSAGLFGLEMHSPIMCIGNGIPAIVCRFAEQTSKGVMWRDIGLGDWLFDMDVPADVSRIVPTVLSMVREPAAAREKVGKARQVVLARQRETMAVVAKGL